MPRHQVEAAGPPLGAYAQHAELPVMGEALLATGSLARLFWLVLDALDYWLMQARLWLADAVCGPGAARSG